MPRGFTVTYTSHATSNRVREQLHDVDVDLDGGVAEREEQVDGRDNCSRSQANDPGPDGVCWHFLVVVPDCGPHFEVRRILLEQGMLEVGLLLDIVGLSNLGGGFLSSC